MRIKKLVMCVLIIFIASIPGCFHSCDDDVTGYEIPDEDAMVQGEPEQSVKEEVQLSE